MFISHIVSKNYLKCIKGRSFYMALANVAIKDEEYLEFYKNKVKKGKFVLLDNGVAENEQLSVEEVWSVAQKINPTEIILHDCLLEPKKTIENSLNSYEFYKKKGYKGQFMFVPQGKNYNEWTTCFDEFNKLNIAHTYGISKFLNNHLKDKWIRTVILNYLEEDYKNISIHLLGCEYNINEYAYINKKEFKNISVRSGDTALAYIYTLNQKYITQGERPLEKTIDFIDQEVSEGLLNLNINKFDRVVRGGKDYV